MKEKIEQYLKSEFAKRLIREQDFFFQKGQDALQKWQNLSVSNEDRTDLLRLADDYEGLQALASTRPTINSILNLLFEVISYCDSKAKDKALHNQYDDNRTLAMAYVRMNHWIEKLINFKFSPHSVPVGSILNAINYLLIPADNATILSENHRAMISKTLFGKEYVRNDFIKDLEHYFSPYKIVVSNSKNYTYLLSCIIYSIKKEWLDDVIGLMASDNTIWKDDLINDMGVNDCAILWNSKRPTGTNNTLKMLRNKINNDEYFKLFYSVHGKIEYVAEIIDFVENDNQLKQKNWASKFKKIVWYQDDFIKYKDDNKSAKIVFLAKKFYKIKAIPASEFEVYKNYSYPTQDNLTPIVSEPDITIIPPTTTPVIISNMRNNNSLNQILYGPPGTGKTYNTINKALSILEPKTQEQINEEERDDLKARFDDYVKKGQIVFTTFHQSMSYEDFIEGIKPLKPEDEDEFVKYDVEEGIFKGLCRQAIKEFYQKGTNNETFERLNSFENAWNDLLENVQFSIDNNVVFPLDTKSGQAMDAFEISNRGNLYLRPQYEGAKDYTVSHDRAQKLFEAFPNLEVVNNIDKEFRSVIGGANSTAYWSVLNYIITWLNENPTAPSIEQTPEISDTLVKFDNKIVKDNITSSVLNYVIIIDEINRGNVSQIFGELITLIEEDKRLGKDEALEVLLPYSKEKFGVPPNLYIIGTMNTADRSVEALDTALRRRFCFEEIEPNPQLIATKGKLKKSNGEVEGISLPRVLETINNRIEILSNRDHKIGHSYFMKVASLEDLKATFKKNIIPLLQEYFYNDYEKIGWVVGEGFFVQQKVDKKTIFTKFFREPKPEFEVAYQLADIDTIDIKKAMLQLLGDFKEETQTENIEN